jgi:WD40 repeat protein
VWSVAFSRDGQQIVSGSYDRTVRLWDAATGTLQQILEGYTASVDSVAFSPDGGLSPSLYVKEDWLINGTTNMLWLPSDYRPSCQAV